MKKFLLVGNIKDFKRFKSDTAMIVASRSGKRIWTQNFEMEPNSAFKVERTAEDEITIKVKLQDGHSFVIQDMPGVAEKRDL